MVAHRLERRQARCQLVVGAGFGRNPISLGNAVSVEPDEESRFDRRNGRVLCGCGVGCAVRVEHRRERRESDPDRGAGEADSPLGTCVCNAKEAKISAAQIPIQSLDRERASDTHNTWSPPLRRTEFSLHAHSSSAVHAPTNRRCRPRYLRISVALCRPSDSFRVARDPTGAGFSTSQMRLRDNDNHVYG
jgi:hypothetical protein